MENFRRRQANTALLGFYVYAFLRKDCSPYYIGKGKGNRAWHRSRNYTRPPKNHQYIVIIKSRMDEHEALTLEKTLIKWYGRQNLGTGILRNLTDGGEGACGMVYSEEVRKRMAKHGIKNGMFGRKHSEEAKEIMSKARSEYSSVSRWYNNGIQNSFAITPPDESWVLGRLGQKATTKGKRTYNNGIVNKTFSEPPTDPEWKLGMLSTNRKGSKLYNNGQENRRFSSPPIDKIWKLGRLGSPNKGKRGFTNGIKTIYAHKNPDPSIWQEGSTKGKVYKWKNSAWGPGNSQRKIEAEKVAKREEKRRLRALKLAKK